MENELKKLYEEMQPAGMTYYDFIELVASEGINDFKRFVDELDVQPSDLYEMHQAVLCDDRHGFIMEFLKRRQLRMFKSLN